VHSPASDALLAASILRESHYALKTGQGEQLPSFARRDSWVGYGWQLSLGAITRSLEKGVPKYNNSDDYLFDDQELVEDSQTNRRYHTKRETFLRIDKISDPAGDYWEVRSKSGTVARYGNTAQSRVDNQSGKTFAWLLSEVEDLHGNAYRVTYTPVPGESSPPGAVQDAGVRYPAEIRYTLRRSGSQLQSLGVDRIVSFQLEPRDDVSVRYSAGFEQELAHRLFAIEVRVGSDLVRRYELGYDESPDSFRSLLAEVRDYGADPAGAPHVTSFSYTNNVDVEGWESSPWSWPSDVEFSRRDQDGGTRVGDMDGDGLPDLVKFVKSWGASTWHAGSGWYPNNGTGFSSGPIATYNLPNGHSFTSVVNPGPNEKVLSNGTFLLDLNRDGQADLLHSSHNAADFYYGSWWFRSTSLFDYHTARRDGGWEARYSVGGMDDGTWFPVGLQQYSLSQGFQDQNATADIWVDGKTQIADLNGDGLPDLVTFYKLDYTPPGSSRQVVTHRSYSLNLGTSFATTLDTGEWAAGCPGSPNGIDACIVNRYRTEPTSGSGNSLTDVVRFGVRHFDVNADGLDDHVVATSSNLRGVSLNDGNGFRNGSSDWNLPSGVKFHESDGKDAGIRIADVNGDGRLDIVRGVDGSSSIWLGTGRPGAAWKAAAADWSARPVFVDLFRRDNGIRLGDFNGDGMLDYARMRDGNNAMYLNRGEVPDLLESVANYLGGTTTFRYAPERVRRMGVIQVVASIIVEAGAGTPARETTFDYAEPEYKVSDREFWGFKTVTAKARARDGQDVLQVERETQTEYFQDKEKFGLPKTVTVKDGAGALRRQTTFTYTPDSNGEPYVSLPATVTTGEFDGETAARESLVEFQYDAYGNLTARIEYGEINSSNATSADDRLVEWAYFYNTTQYVVDRAKTRWIRTGSTPGGGNVVRQSDFFYDCSTPHACTTGEPVKGNLSLRIDRLMDTSSPPKPDPSTGFYYDQYGNLEEIEDPRLYHGHRI
jgi:hypothetical protein